MYDVSEAGIRLMGFIWLIRLIIGAAIRDTLYIIDNSSVITI